MSCGGGDEFLRFFFFFAFIDAPFQLHVEGQFCNKCVSGYFGLTAENPEGCIKCYCSGVGTSCESSHIVTRTVSTSV